MRSGIRSIKAWAAGHPYVVDGGFALLLIAVGLFTAHAGVQTLHQQDPTYDAHEGRVLFGMLLMGAPYALRRRAPLVALVAGTAAFIVGRQALGTFVESAATSIILASAFYAAAAYGDLRRRTLVCSVCLLLLTIELLVETWGVGTVVFVLALVFTNSALAITMWALGAAVRAARSRNAALVLRTVELEHQREENARRAVLDERVRIARELHDVVAHHVSVIGVQAGAARVVMDRDPVAAASTLRSIEHESRQAVQELHRLLGVLRQSDDIDGLAPQPGLAQLPALATAVGQAGIHVVLRIDGEVRTVSPTVDVSAYRIAQEALTNAIKHSGSTRARVQVSYRADSIELAVEDDGGGAPQLPISEPARAGLGLAGMRERAALHGGELAAGPRPGGGFSVRATLPAPRAPGVPSPPAVHGLASSALTPAQT